MSPNPYGSNTPKLGANLKTGYRQRNQMLQPAFMPIPPHFQCPYQRKALDLYFAVQWLQEPMRGALLSVQRQSHQSPPPDMPADKDHLQQHRLEYLGKMSGEWMTHPKLGLLPPRAATTIAVRHDYELEVAAQRLFLDVLAQELKKSWIYKHLSNQYDPFVVWYGRVKERETQPGMEAAERLYAEKEIIEEVRAGRVDEVVKALVYVTEIDFTARQLSMEKIA